MLFSYDDNEYINKYSTIMKEESCKKNNSLDPIWFENLLTKMKEETICKDIIENNDYTNYKKSDKLTDNCPGDYCPNCNADALQYDPNYGIVCIECGIKINNVMSNDKEWQEYNQSKIGCLKDDVRCSNYSSTIVPNIARKMTFKGLGYNSPLNQIHNWSETSYKDKSMFKTYRDMMDTYKELDLNHIIIEAFKVYKKIYEKKLYRGRNRKAIKAACILYIIRKSDDPTINTINIKRLSNISGLKKGIILNGYKKVKEILHRYNLDTTNTIQINTNNFITKYCINLGINYNYQKIIQELMNGLEILGTINNNTDKTQITGCIYTIVRMYNLENVNKELIPQICGISDVTLQKCYSKILTVINDIFDLNDEEKNNLGLN